MSDQNSSIQLSAAFTKARREAAKLIEQLDASSTQFSALSLMIAAIAEYYASCEQNGGLAASATVFGEEIAQTTFALAVVHYTTLQQTFANADFNDLPAGAFIAPGPSEPQ